ncbi:MAG: DNA primase small subunit PriS [Conexivisphaerales archaeon]
MESKAFVKVMFRKFYQSHSLLKSSFISEINRREFGFNLFEGRMLRHKSFKKAEDLEAFLRDSVPSDAYFSCAYYENPEAEMDRKGWLGADLIFDIDADHIPTPCSKIHDTWICSNCGFTGRGITPEKCPICSGEKFDATTWPCEICLESAKVETLKLLDMLTKDFGFSEKEIRLFFSGHRGYHIHIESDIVKKLDALARKEIVDYMICQGLDIISYSKRKRNNLFKDHTSDYSWAKRIKESMAKFIHEATEDDLREIGLKKNISKTVIQNKETFIKNLKLGTFHGVGGVGFETFKKLIEHAAKIQSVKIDTVVTTDVHRLIRLPETLHGKTGLKKVEFSPSEIDNFDPFKRAIAFKEGTITVFVSDSPEFRVSDETYGPYKNQKVTLPTAAAMLLICKGKAEVLE